MCYGEIPTSRRRSHIACHKFKCDSHVIGDNSSQNKKNRCGQQRAMIFKCEAKNERAQKNELLRKLKDKIMLDVINFYSIEMESTGWEIREGRSHGEEERREEILCCWFFDEQSRRL